MNVALEGVGGTARGSAYRFLNSVVRIVATPETDGGAFWLFHQVAPAGFATPYHMHKAYGEGFYVLDGEVTFFCDGKRSVLSAGEYIFLPGELPHGFRVSGSAAATMLIVSPPQSSFAAFVMEMGEATTSLELPVPSKPDFARLGALSAKYGSETLGPLPG